MLNIFYISTKCKVDLSTKAAHFGLSHTLKRSSKRPLFYFIFSELALMLLKWILLEYVHFNGLKCCFERVSITSQFWGSKMQKLKYLKKIAWVHFFRIEEWVISNPSSHIEKTPNLWIFAYERFFMIFFLKSSFSTFSDIFLKINCTY